MYDFELIYLKTRSARGKGRKMFPISPDPKPYLVLSISMWRENSFTGGTLWRADSLIKMMQLASNIAHVGPHPSGTWGGNPIAFMKIVAPVFLLYIFILHGERRFYLGAVWFYKDVLLLPCPLINDAIFYGQRDNEVASWWGTYERK